MTTVPSQGRGIVATAALRFVVTVAIASLFRPRFFSTDILVLADDVAASECRPGANDRFCDTDSMPFTPTGGESGQPCRLYLAESSIPGAGWGVYTSVPLGSGDRVASGAAGDVIIPLLDVGRQDELRSERKRELLSEAHREKNGSIDATANRYDLSLLRTETSIMWMPLNYYWEAYTLGMTHLADNVAIIVPGVGALVNCHPGLNNIVMKPTEKAEKRDRERVPSAGASTSFEDARFLVSRDLPAGTELFSSYGDLWFKNRINELGYVPLHEDWSKADSLLFKVEQFISKTISKVEWGMGSGESKKKAYQSLWDLVRDGGFHSPRLKNTLPEEWEVLRKISTGISGSIHDTGGRISARHMTPGAVRSMDWLVKNGRCMDNVEPSTSNILNARKGAFSVRSMKMGMVIITSPVMHIRRGRLSMHRREKDGTLQDAGQQLMLNYCYGNPNSTVLIFPYGSGINLLNHGGEAVSNAKLHWPTDLPLHNSDWLNLSSDDLIAHEHSGLTVEIVATRDIQESEEILIDYGKEWEDAWNNHLRNWKPPNDTSRTDSDVFHLSAENLNRKSVILTREEQIETPYSPNIMTRCFINADVFRDPSYGKTHGQYDAFVWSFYQASADNSLPCEVLSRETDNETGKAIDASDDVYTVLMTLSERKAGREKWMPERRKVAVTGVPRMGVVFVDRPHLDHQFLNKPFRHMIGMPDGMFPKAWMDL